MGRLTRRQRNEKRSRLDRTQKATEPCRLGTTTIISAVMVVASVVSTVVDASSSTSVQPTGDAARVDRGEDRLSIHLIPETNDMILAALRGAQEYVQAHAEPDDDEPLIGPRASMGDLSSEFLKEHALTRSPDERVAEPFIQVFRDLVNVRRLLGDVHLRCIATQRPRGYLRWLAGSGLYVSHGVILQARRKDGARLFDENGQVTIEGHRAWTAFQCCVAQKGLRMFYARS